MLNSFKDSVFCINNNLCCALSNEFCRKHSEISNLDSNKFINN